jgi:YVTN family beta-propeller protein
VEAQHVIADPTRGVFYATVAGDSAVDGNSLVVVDAATATVKDSVFVGSEPWTMALSDDASTLWVSLRGSYEIRRVDLTSGSPVPAEQYSLPPGEFGDLAFAGPMVVLPGTTGSVAVSLHYPDLSPSYAGSAIIDDGVPRPQQTPGHTGASQLTGGPAGWLFGFNNLHTGFGFYSLQISPMGLTSTEHDSLVSGFYTDIVYAGDRVYATSGEIVNVSNPAAPKKAGQFAFAGSAVVPLTTMPRLLMLSVDFIGPVTLRYLNTDTFTQVDSVTFPNLQLDSAVDLVSTDGATLAFVGQSGFDKPPQLYLVINPFSG